MFGTLMGMRAQTQAEMDRNRLRYLMAARMTATADRLYLARAMQAVRVPCYDQAVVIGGPKRVPDCPLKEPIE